jgi:tripartite-type tricarboxylate transporter receptor subunit TctC
MKPARRRFLRVAVGAVALPAVTRIAWALDYPSRPVRVLVGFAAAGPTDIAARLAGQWLSQRLDRQFVIENRPGASSNIATEAVVRAQPDGYTLLVFGTPAAINATLYANLSFNIIRDIAPVAGFVRSPLMMLVNPSLPARTVPEFIAYAKANPGKLNMATAGNGTTPHVCGALFGAMTGIDLVPVAYRGGAPGLMDLMGGQVQVMFEGIASSIGYIKAGKLRALAITSATRSAALPEVPTVAEFVAGYEASSFFGIGAPKGTPAQIVSRLNSEINAGLADRQLKERLADLGGDPLPMSPSEFGRLIADETEKWGKVIKTANMKPE